MKPLILLVVLCSLSICTLDAAPVLPNLGLPETFEKQQLDYMERLPDFYSQIRPMILLAADNVNRAGNRHGSIQADDELGRMLLNFASSFPLAASKNGDLSDEEKGQIFRDGYGSALSSIGKQLGGEIQSDDVEIMQIFANHFGSPHSGIAKKTKNGEILSQSAGDKEIERKLLNDARNFFTAVSKIDPDSEVIQTLVNGANTLLSFAGRQIENGGEVHVQSSDVNGEVKRAFMNLAISLLSMTRKIINDTYDAKIQSEEFHRTMLNIMKFLLPAMYRNAISRAGPNNEMLSKIHEWFGTMLPISADLEVGRRDNEKMRKGLNQFIDLLSALAKEFKNSSKFRNRSTSKFAPVGRIILKFMNSMFHNLSKGIEPEDYMPPGFVDQFNQKVDTFLSMFGKIIGIDNDREGEIQSDEYTDREFLKTVLNLMQDINSNHQKKAKPKELEFLQPFFTVTDKILTAVKDIYGFGGAQTVHMDTLPTDHVDQKMSVESWNQNAAAGRFDQKVSVKSRDRKAAAVMEVDDDGDMGLPEETKVQLWRALLRPGLASGLLNKKYLS